MWSYLLQEIWRELWRVSHHGPESDSVLRPRKSLWLTEWERRGRNIDNDLFTKADGSEAASSCWAQPLQKDVLALSAD